MTKIVLKTSVLLCIQSFLLNNNSVEKKINIQQVLLFSFLKKPGLKNKKKIKKIKSKKMLLLIFLVFSQFGLACKYGKISPISTYNWMQNCIF